MCVCVCVCVCACFSDKPTELLFNFSLISTEQFLAAAVINSLYTICSAPHSRNSVKNDAVNIVVQLGTSTFPLGLGGD